VKISVKGRYALAAAITLAENYDRGDIVSIISIADRLGLSKIYLEQVFSLLKRAGLVTSVKGAQGGYQLARKPRQITILDVLAAVEQALFEATEPTVASNAPELDQVMREAVFDRLDEVFRGAMSQITLDDLMSDVERKKSAAAIMFYI
jgi:Rrf2 family protein